MLGPGLQFLWSLFPLIDLIIIWMFVVGVAIGVVLVILAVYYILTWTRTYVEGLKLDNDNNVTDFRPNLSTRNRNRFVKQRDRSRPTRFAELQRMPQQPPTMPTNTDRAKIPTLSNGHSLIDQGSASSTRSIYNDSDTSSEGNHESGPETSFGHNNSKDRLSAHFLVCDFCGKTFPFFSQLKVHVRTHTGEKPFQCLEPGCGKCFHRKTILNDHRWSHCKDKQFQCSNCDKSFKYPRSLKLHVKLHTGENLFECSEPGCGKRFADKAHFNIHLQIHSKEPAFKCDLCSKFFKQREGLKSHLETHNDQTFICHECGISYSKKRSFSSHMRKKHRN